MKSTSDKTDKRVYVCHTYYHVLVSVLKEMTEGRAKGGEAVMLLSKMSNDFETLSDRLKASGLFKDVLDFDEKRETFFPELAKYREDKGSIIPNMYNRILFTKKFAKLEEKYIPIDFREFNDIYVFCDSDPVGIYLNQHRIKYHAVEDGLNTLKPFVQAKYNDRGHFGIKKFFSMNLNLIFMCDGYSKYCIDMEVNDISVIDDDFYKYKEVPRKALLDSLSSEDKERLVRIFIKDTDALKAFVAKNNRDGILILTEPLCTLDVREKIFRDLTAEYSKEGTVFLKPHPRDALDYNKLFSEFWIFDRTIPMELLGLFEGIRFKKVVGVYTHLDLIDFADEKIMLGDDFMDKYEDPSVHRKAEAVEKAFKK
ncbi:MAG: lipooligosaccharide sialyltransferase [Lachnospiraceae bacterium]|nr:lipooligosaccharide sialyltransferase [Lachnospiraceae bacterium]